MLSAKQGIVWPYTGGYTFGEGNCSKEIMHVTAYGLETKRKNNFNVDINIRSFISKTTVDKRENSTPKLYQREFTAYGIMLTYSVKVMLTLFN